jgi:general secretion pathway protein N
MEWSEMMLRLAIGVILLIASAHGAPALTSAAATAPPDGEGAEDTRAVSPAASAIWEKPAAPAQVKVVTAPAAPAPVAERALSANPLWAIPLSALSGTRDRPIFSASRRPIPPAVAPAAVPKLVAAPKPREPERPQLSLVGTIASGDEGFGIFLDQSTKAALRLKVGEDYQGWKLRSVQGREATLEKDQQAIVLALPQPGVGRAASGAQTTGEVRSPPANATTRLSGTAPPGPGPESGPRRRDR